MRIPFNNPIDKDNPCDRDCPERTSTCHSTCGKYKTFRERKDQELHERSLESARLNPISEANIRKMWKNKTKSKGKRHQNRVGNY